MQYANLPWAQSLNLSERVCLLGRFQPPEELEVLSKARITKWSAQFRLDAVSVALRWQKECELTSDAMQLVIGTPAQVVAENSNLPTWLTLFERAMQLQQTEQIDWTADLGKERKKPDLEIALIWPWLHLARFHLESHLQRFAGGNSIRCNPVFLAEDLLGALRRSLCNFSRRTLVLELNVARLRGQLQGETSEIRYREFCREIAEQRADAIFQEYPVLARLLCEETERWMTSVTEILERLEKDWVEIGDAIFRSRFVGTLYRADLRAGDRHNRGRSVCILTFEDGTKLAYKPRSLHSESAWLDLLQWLYSQQCIIGWKPYTLINRGEYGWCEYIEAKACLNPAALARFYYRQGELLAIAWMLRIVDLTSENVIAAGEYPLLIDAECCFHPICGTTPEDRQIESSLLGLGLLPRVRSTASQFDPAALAPRDGYQVAPFAIPALDDGSDDECRIVRKALRVETGTNAPTCTCHEAFPLAEQVVAGFTTTYQRLLGCRQSLFSSSAVQSLRSSKVRAVPRSSSVYSHFLFESTHPNLLRDALDRDVLFSMLVGQSDWRAILARYERDALWNWDIPAFGCSPDEPDLWVWNQEQRVGQLPGKGPFPETRQHAMKASINDLARHVWIIRQSLRLNASSTDQPEYTWRPPVEPGSKTMQDDCIHLASEIGLRLMELSDHNEQDISWIDVISSTQQSAGHFIRSARLVPLGIDLYSGKAGMLFFFCCLSTVTQDPVFREFATRLARSLALRIAVLPPGALGCGGMSGAAGILYAFTFASEHLRMSESEPLNVRLMEEMGHCPQQSMCPDFVNGIAGAICGLLTCYSFSSKHSELELAVNLGYKLTDSAVRMSVGVGWKMANTRPIGGLAHGNAGIALALARLWRLTNIPVFRDIAIEALRYEATTFNAETRNWQDLREFSQGSTFESSGMIAWCTGAPGIGLSRLALADLISRESLIEQIDNAFETTADCGLGGSDCLCHGTFGNLLFLHEAALQTKRHDLRTKSESLIQERIKRIAEHGFQFETGAEILNLMTGLAGCGYALLSIAKPTLLPSLLLLAPPAAIVSFWEQPRMWNEHGQQIAANLLDTSRLSNSINGEPE